MSRLLSSSYFSALDLVSKALLKNTGVYTAYLDSLPVFKLYWFEFKDNLVWVEGTLLGKDFKLRWKTKIIPDGSSSSRFHEGCVVQTEEGGVAVGLEAPCTLYG